MFTEDKTTDVLRRFAKVGANCPLQTRRVEEGSRPKDPVVRHPRRLLQLIDDRVAGVTDVEQDAIKAALFNLPADFHGTLLVNRQFREPVTRLCRRFNITEAGDDNVSVR